jgi:hypothetical protein
MATDPATKSVVKCLTCGQVLMELPGECKPGSGGWPWPGITSDLAGQAEQVVLQIREAAQAHQTETGICSGQIQVFHSVRITED